MNPFLALRRLVAPTALFVSVAALPALACAQQPAPDVARSERGRRSPAERIEHRMAMMTQRLGLSADQQTRIRQILTQHQQQRQAMRGQPGERTPEQHRARMAARFAMHDQIAAVLNPQQRQQMQQLHRERMMERGGRRGHGGWRGRGGFGGRGGRGGRGRMHQVPPGAV